jgi:hypothetical protein
MNKKPVMAGYLCGPSLTSSIWEHHVWHKWHSACLWQRWAKPGVNWNESTSLEQPAGQMHSGPPCRGCLYLSVMNMDTMYPPSVTTALATAGVWTEMVGSWRVAVPHLGWGPRVSRQLLHRQVDVLPGLCSHAPNSPSATFCPGGHVSAYEVWGCPIP